MVMKGLSENIIDASKPVAPDVRLKRYPRNDPKKTHVPASPRCREQVLSGD
jgi:hypothetical protein